MAIRTRTLLLFSTPACHLCENAKALIEPHLDSAQITLLEVDISESDDMIDSYGIRIPVLKFSEGKAELGWPFSTEDFLEFIRQDL